MAIGEREDATSEAEQVTDSGQSAFDVEPRTESVILKGDLPSGFTLRRPVVAKVWAEGDEYVADVEELNASAFGATFDEALKNVGDRIVEQYQTLQDLADRLMPAMEGVALKYRALVLSRDA